MADWLTAIAGLVVVGLLLPWPFDVEAHELEHHR